MDERYGKSNKYITGTPECGLSVAVMSAQPLVLNTRWQWFSTVTLSVPDVCVFVTSGLSKWVRQLVQHHHTFNNAMRSLVAFSQVQRKVQGPPAAVSPPNGHPGARGLPDATDPQTPGSCVKQPEPQQDTSLFTSTQGKATQREKAGELSCKLKVVL